ncbi:MAG: hypothetical protein HC795_05730 [Coleofasciculaceae cyanobacterium RL_1_1]|nr:hypothetical protein [Coleofasciculaceae cyanobacterium RL_1_1]
MPTDRPAIESVASLRSNEVDLATSSGNSSNSSNSGNSTAPIVAWGTPTHSTVDFANTATAPRTAATTQTTQATSGTPTTLLRWDALERPSSTPATSSELPPHRQSCCNTGQPDRPSKLEHSKLDHHCWRDRSVQTRSRSNSCFRRTVRSRQSPPCLRTEQRLPNLAATAPDQHPRPDSTAGSRPQSTHRRRWHFAAATVRHGQPERDSARSLSLVCPATGSLSCVG